MNISYSKRSSLDWEGSYYGGFVNVIYSLPIIIIDTEYAFEYPKCNLDYYNRRKLIKFFLYRLVLNRSISRLFVNATIVEREDGLFLKKMKRYLRVDDNVQRELYNQIIRDNHEYVNLFKHYEEFIIGTEILYEIKEDKDKDKSPDDGPMSKEQQETKDKDDTIEKALENMKKDKMTYTTWGSGYDEGLTKKKAEFENIDANKYKKYGAFQPTAEEMVYTKQLVDRLDISFDPESDKVGGLKYGKLDHSKIAEFLAGNQHIFYRIEEDQRTKPFSVCLLCDESGSMRGGNDYIMNCIVRILYKTFSEILPKDKLWIYGHSGSTSSIVYVYQDMFGGSYEESHHHMMNSTHFHQNYDGPAMEGIYNRIRGFTDDNVLMIVISDGIPAGYGYGGEPAIREMRKVIEKAKRDNFYICGIGINTRWLSRMYAYNVVINKAEDVPLNTSILINKVVKTEFQ